MSSFDLDTNHTAILQLKRLLPEATIIGGTFKNSLPNPNTIDRSERQILVNSIQKEVTDQCLSQFFNTSQKILRNPNGTRNWPQGFTGSITHKGTVVLIAIAKEEMLQHFGIDLEYEDYSDLTNLEKGILPEGISGQFSASKKILIGFSIREAVFKAQFSITRKVLNSIDLEIFKFSSTNSEIKALVKIPGGISFVVKCTIFKKWVLSVAKLA